MGLHPAGEEESLEAALQRIVEAFRVNTLLPVEFPRGGGYPRLSCEQRVHVQLLVREALASVARHAGAGRVVVKAGTQDGEFQLAVTDDGRGFDLEAASRGGGLGLGRSVQRARRLGGRLDIDTLPGGGTTGGGGPPVPGGEK